MTLARFRAMGCEVVVDGAPAAELAAIERLFSERNDTFSRFVPGSELNRVNASQEDAVLVSPAFARALALALDAATATGGLFDPTVAEALLAAGYDRDFAELAPDPRPAGHGPSGRVRSVRLAGRVVLRPAGLLLDLNGVVKSLTVDDAAALLSGTGFVSAGGDLAVRAEHPVGLPGGGSVTVRSGGLATTGTTTRSWLRAGVRQHHLIDPRTGRPGTARWAQVTVSGATCLAADVAAKAAFLLDGEGPAWLDTRSIPGRFVRHDGGIVVNDAWERSMSREPVREHACT